MICFCCTCFLEKVTLNLEFEELGVDFGWGLGWLEGQRFGKLTRQFPNGPGLSRCISYILKMGIFSIQRYVRLPEGKNKTKHQLNFPTVIQS